jgi:hypothetical protein
MNNQNSLHTVKELGRKKFFSKISKGFMGLVILSSFPFNLFGRNSSSRKIKININPLAVKREKGNKKNG